MKGTKRILSWLLIVCAVFGMLPAVALAADPIEAGEYVIAACVDGTYYAMSNTTFSGRIAGTEIAVTDGRVSESDAQGYRVTLTKTDGGYTIYNGTKYLAYASGTNFGADSNAYEWSITEGINGSYRITSNGVTTRGLVYRSGSFNQFGGYALTNVTAESVEYYDLEFLPIEGEIEQEPESTAAPEMPQEPSVEIADGTYVIAAKVDNTYYALSNSFPTAAATMAVSTITVVDGKVPGTCATDFAVEIKKTSGGYTISRDDQYLIHGNASTGLMSSTTAYEWEFAAGTNGSVRMNAPDTYEAAYPGLCATMQR